jgi:hypothetical protein
MTSRHATLIVAGLTGILAILSGCATVNSTAAYYTSYGSRVYPAKPSESVIPPSSTYTAIGRLAFESDRGWLFLRKSMVYNARIHGADAVVLKSATTRREISLRQVPPQVDWVPIGSRRGKHGMIYSHRVPFVRPGYTQRWVDVITAIDAEMIVLKN